MFCKYCGSQIKNPGEECPACGKTVPVSVGTGEKPSTRKDTYSEQKRTASSSMQQSVEQPVAVSEHRRKASVLPLISVIMLAVMLPAVLLSVAVSVFNASGIRNLQENVISVKQTVQTIRQQSFSGPADSIEQTEPASPAVLETVPREELTDGTEKESQLFRITEYPQDSLVEQGTEGAYPFIVNATGENLSFNWYRWDEKTGIFTMIEDGDPNFRITTSQKEGKSALIIINADKQVEGFYYCCVKNKDGESLYTQPVKLTVQQSETSNFEGVEGHIQFDAVG